MFNVFKFKIRIRLVPDQIGCEEGLMWDELPSKSVAILWLHGDYDWLDRTSGAPSNSTDKHVLIQRKLMAAEGFTDVEVYMEAEFVDGKLEVTIVSDKDFNEIRQTRRGTLKYTYKMTLLDCIKNVLNGQLSDGIGENRIGYCEYKNHKYEMWFGELETDAELSEIYGDQYFKVNVIKD